MALSLGGLVVAAAFVGITVQGNAIAREKAAYQAEIAAEEARYASMTAQIETKKTPDYVTQKARDYGFIGPNETLISVQRGAQVVDSATKAAVPRTSRLQRWFTFFFGSR